MFGLGTDLVPPCPCIYKCITTIRHMRKSGRLCIFLHHFAMQKIFCQGELAVAGLIERLGTGNVRG